MIQVESVTIKEFRGIRDLTLEMNRESFVISGPNGSGKSGAVDAIEFALTGEIGRLKGTGTGDLKLSEHGPHVEMRNYPDASSVRLDVYIPHLKKKASITRTIHKPKQPTITPDEEGIKAVFAEVAEHSEITLSRREIIKFILAEAGQRSQDVQTLLKLDDIDQTRATLKTTENKLNAEYSTAKTQAEAAEQSLKRHLDIPALKPEDVLSSINKRRKVLGLSEIITLTKDTTVSEGIAQAPSEVGQQTKESSLGDIKALSTAMETGLKASTEAAITLLLDNIAKLESNPTLLASIKTRSFLQTGLNLIEGPHCPLCDADWKIEELRAHLQEKLDNSTQAQLLSDQILKSGQVVSQAVTSLLALIDPLTKLPETDKEVIKRLGEWSGDLQTFSKALTSVEGTIALKDRLATGWATAPPTLNSDVEAVKTKVMVRPDKSATGNARDFLVVAQERLSALWFARREADAKMSNASLGKSAYKIYCDVAEASLTSLYEEVEGDFCTYYRLINQDDEGEFKAKFEPSDGKLGLLVDFHKKGMFPPAAYHSEGHQDGMGVCLYLALMKRVLGENFTLAVLDDVVMSVDSQHRKQFCKLLKTHFPQTQFVITTHDQVWSRQIRTEGVVGAKSAVAFHTWTVDTGPVLDEVAEIWDQIETDMTKNEIPTAAGRLRRHLEYVSADLADELGAKVKYRSDGGYDMGELLSAVIGRQGELLKLAAKAAASWDDAEQKAKVEELQNRRSEILAASNGEQWVINKAIHYNEWADLSRNDFKPVVSAFRDLLRQFRCQKTKCDSWLSLTPKNDPVDLRCSCGSFRLNLKERNS
jgi:energy-coupling factor transporter ATP-binding protein EcfA2